MTVPLIILALFTAFGGLFNLPFLTAQLAERFHQSVNDLWLGLESWLEHSILSFELTEEGLVHMPHTPIVISPRVALISTALALIALAAAFFVYRRRPETATDRDPLQRTPIWWFAVLPLNTIVMNWLRPLFNRLSKWLAFKLDWAFWHDFVHENIIRDMFVSFADFLSNIIDKEGVDGTVLGIGHITRRFAGVLRTMQTGYVRNYALSIFLGAVALVIYFLIVAFR